MSIQNTISFQTLYAETVAEQIMLAAIQVPTHIQVPQKKQINQLLLSYNHTHKNSILQSAVYGFWAKEKKNALFITISDDDQVSIQNPQNTDQTGKGYSPYITDTHYPISTNSRISTPIEKHLSYIALLTDIEQISIIHIPQEQLFNQTIIDYINEHNTPETVVIYLSNILDPEKTQNKNDILIYTLRQHTHKNNHPETLRYKTTDNTLIHKQNYLHQGV